MDTITSWVSASNYQKSLHMKQYDKSEAERNASLESWLNFNSIHMLEFRLATKGKVIAYDSTDNIYF